MKKALSLSLVVILAAVLMISANAAGIANHLFDKQGGIDAGGQTWSVYGWIVTDAEITSAGYILDNGDISTYKEVVTGIENDTRENASTKSGVSDAYRDLALEDAVKNGGMGGGVSWDILRAYRIQIVLDLTDLAAGKHTVLLCVKFKDGGISEAFRTQSEFTFTKAGSGEEVVSGGKGASTRFLVDSDNSDETKIAATGWAGSTVETVKLGYRIDDKDTIYNENHVQLIPLNMINEGDEAVMDAAGAYAFRFKVNIPISELPEGDHHIKLVMQDEDGGETVVGSSGGSEELMFYYEADEVITTETVTETETETETETDAATEMETDAKTEAKTDAATETEADVTTEAVTEADTAAQSEEATEKGEETTEAVTSDGKGLPTGAVIAIVAAAVIVVGVIVALIVKKKK